VKNMDDLLKYTSRESGYHSVTLRDTYRVSTNNIKIETIDIEEERKEKMRNLLVYRGYHYCSNDVFR